jgi:hypothetical protein
MSDVRGVAVLLLACALGGLAWIAPDSHGAAYTSTVLADDPVVYLRFEETEGSAAANSGSLGSSHDATYYGGYALGQLGPISSEAANNAVRLNGTDAFIQLNSPVAGSTFADGYSVELWFNSSDLRTHDLFAGTTPGANNHGILLEARSDGKLRYLHRAPAGTGGGQNINPSAQGYTVNQWHHFVAVLDEDAAAGTRAMRLYVDGVLDSVTNTAAADIDFDLDAVVGKLGALSTQRFFNGLVDELAIYDFPLDNPDRNASTDDSRVGAHFAAAVPEPAGLWLAAVVLTASTLRRRRDARWGK